MSVRLLQTPVLTTTIGCSNRANLSWKGYLRRRGEFPYVWVWVLFQGTR